VIFFWTRFHQYGDIVSGNRRHPMFSHLNMSPRRCISDGSAIALSAASAVQRYSSVNSAPTSGDVDYISVNKLTLETTASNQLSCDKHSGYIHHPIYGFLPAATPYLALLARRMVS
jgi:hypothetical protein